MSKFTKIILNYDEFQISKHTIESVDYGNELISDCNNLIHSYENKILSLKLMIDSCSAKIKIINNDLSQRNAKCIKEQDDFVFSTVKGMLSWRERVIETNNKFTESDVNNKFIHTNDSNTSPILESGSSIINSVINGISAVKQSGPKFIRYKTPTGQHIKLPIVRNLKHIQPMFYWYESTIQKNDNHIQTTNHTQKTDKIDFTTNHTHATNTTNTTNHTHATNHTHTSGIYCCISPGVYAKAPFPEIVDGSKDINRMKSIKCKYGTAENCSDQKNKMSKYHNSQIRTCNFAHKGEKIIKIGCQQRCSSVITFGNPSTFSTDVKKINSSDINSLLLYGLNDLIISALWFDNQNGCEKYYNDLDVC